MSLSSPDRVLEVVAPATYCGRMGDEEVGYLELWTLDEAIGDYPIHTTLSRRTIEGLGFRLPERTHPCITD